ncbi:MAG: coproporphyrinogen oxidase [Solirubrobacterales bacterium]|nr:coproporphyrinogen oxidase [Solirubrobacterales bacterium]
MLERLAQRGGHDVAAGLADRHPLAEALDAVRGGDDLTGAIVMGVGDDVHGGDQANVAAVRGLYVHVPYCAARCGYCDFNTYVAPASEREGFAALAAQEIALAVAAWPGALDTVFFGGGTPTLLPPADLAAILGAAREHFGLAAGDEVTTEANPDSVDAGDLVALREAGFTRVSFGMQSAVESVLAVLDRRHTPGRPAAAAAEARAAGFEHVSLDLIYGTPGETDDDWRASLDAVVAAAPDHASAYPLVVERGTALHARVRRGQLPEPDPDAQARRYAMADAAFGAAGLSWYELFNWSRPGAECRHNLGYWRGGDWWGIGPGAHGHVAGTRWWNVRRPAEYARRLAAGELPEGGREELAPGQRRLERVMLELRLREGLDLSAAGSPEAAPALAADGLIDVAGGRAVLTPTGRQVADRVTVALAG